MDREAIRNLHLSSFTTMEATASKIRELAPEETTPPVAPPKEPKGDETLVEGPFVLSEALPVVPSKLVRRILRAEYVDMAELLKDNMEAAGGCVLSGPLHGQSD